MPNRWSTYNIIRIFFKYFVPSITSFFLTWKGTKLLSSLFSLVAFSTKYWCPTVKRLVKSIIEVQDFDLGAIEHFTNNPKHFEVSSSEYANPANRSAYVNKLDFVVLSALEIDTNFNVNVITGSYGLLRGAPWGHPDTAAWSKCCIIVTPLTCGRMATVCENVVTITTPRDCWYIGNWLWYSSRPSKTRFNWMSW